MNPLEKQISRLPKYYREEIPISQLRYAVQMLNAMKSVQVHGEAALKCWAKKTLSAELRCAVEKMAEVGDKYEDNLSGQIWLLLDMIDR